MLSCALAQTVKRYKSEMMMLRMYNLPKSIELSCQWWIAKTSRLEAVSSFMVLEPLRMNEKPDL
jgi:hypothetical protein